MITSVLGELPDEHLGPTDCHDHLLIRGGLPIVVEPDFRLDSVDAAIAETRELQAAGGAAIVDCMPLGVGRDAAGLVAVARATGLIVIAATGFHKDQYYTADHWAREYDVDQITGLVVSEFDEGMERTGYGGPFVERIAARPGVIKVATSASGPTLLEEKLLRAVGAAAVATGLPVITHTEDEKAADAQLSALDREGLPPHRVILSHMDRHSGPDELARLCSTGTTVCLDWLGRLDRRPDEVVVQLVAGLLAHGHGDRVVLGQDLARRQYWHAYDGGPGLEHLFTTVVPLMRAAGLSDADIDTVMVETPRRAFRHEQGVKP